MNAAASLGRREWRELNLSSSPVGSTASSASFASSAASSEGPLTILTVCTGNICRSPMAEVVLRARLEPHGVRIHSGGTHALVGHEMTEQAQALAVGAGARSSDAAAHAARFLVEPMLLGADLVLAMTREHRSHSVKMMPSAVRRTLTVREFARLASVVSTEELRVAADAGGADAHARFAAALQVVGGQRTHMVGATDPKNDDVIDPYRRSAEIYAEAANQLLPALDEVERVVRATLG